MFSIRVTESIEQEGFKLLAGIKSWNQRMAVHITDNKQVTVIDSRAGRPSRGMKNKDIEISENVKFQVEGNEFI